LPQPPVIRPHESSFIELQSVDSTNNYARQQIHAGLAQPGMAWFAHEQVAGKGQRGKIWQSEKNSTISLSVVIKPGLLSFQLTGQFQLSACVAVAVHDFFTKYAGDDTKIKWPNDLYWQDRKAGGILIESIVRSQESGGIDDLSKSSGWSWAIIGIGINITQAYFSPFLPNPVSLKQITGKSFEPLLLAKELYKILLARLDELSTNGFENIYAQYLQQLYKRNEIVKLKKDNRVFEARIKTISPLGKLVVEHATEEEFNFGEVEWLFR